MKKLKSLLSDIGSIRKGVKVSEGNFNIFSILDRERDEVKCHSKFISFLLNPKEVHGKKSLFLSEFMRMLNEKGYSFEYCPNEPFEISVEKHISGGRLDICLEFSNQVILIENKIDAWEQEDQLRRYQSYLEGRKKSGAMTCLIYLTKYGENSQTAEPGTDYLRLSYKEDIKLWLESCIEGFDTHSPHVLSCLLQYKDLINKICTGSNTENRGIKALLRNTEKLNDAILLKNSLEELRVETDNSLTREFLSAAERKLKESNYEILEPPKQGDGVYFNLSHIFGEGVRGRFGWERNYLYLTFHFFKNGGFADARTEPERHEAINKFLKEIMNDRLGLESWSHLNNSEIFGWMELHPVESGRLFRSLDNEVFKGLITGNLELNTIALECVDLGMRVLKWCEELAQSELDPAG